MRQPTARLARARLFSWLRGLLHADARRLDALADSSIFLVMFSCNGIGMVSHEDRLLILREVLRVLLPGDLFLFPRTT